MSNGDQSAFPSSEYSACPSCDGKGAHPALNELCDMCGHSGRIYSGQNRGITKREYFAAKAMQGMNANPDLMEVVTKGCILDGSAFVKMAAKSFEIADAMLMHQELNIKKESTNAN